MINSNRRNPKFYNGIRPTSHQIRDILPSVLKEIQTKQSDRPDIILSTWPIIIGEKLAPMTKAISFHDGILTVLVRNSTLYSLLCQHEKKRIMQKLFEIFPTVKVKNIIFKIG